MGEKFLNTINGFDVYSQMLGKYELTEIKAIAETAGDVTVQDALYLHNTDEQFRDGDCVVFGYNLQSWESEEELEESMKYDSAMFDSCFEIDEEGIYHV